MRQGIVKMLRKTGFEVFEVAEGSSAIKLLRGEGGKMLSSAPGTASISPSAASVSSVHAGTARELARSQTCSNRLR